MSNQFPLRLESYFFIDQSLTALSEFESSAPSIFKHKVSAKLKYNEEKGYYSAWATVELDENESKNASYTYHFSTFGTFIIETEFPEALATNIIKELGIPLLIGVIRERLAMLSASGPWQPVYLDFIPHGEIQY